MKMNHIMCCYLCTLQGFQLPLTLVQQWQCHYLMDCAALQQQQQQQQQGGSSSSVALDEACSLLGAVACPSTPFRWGGFVIRNYKQSRQLLALY
jgi:hypothetical protein